MSTPDRHPAPDPAAVLALFRAYQRADAEFRLYMLGLCDGLGIARERFAGIDDATGELLLTPEAVEDPPATK